jgi:CRP/FNR family transcriptional regulator, cyclic AMP receptor protein
MKIHLFDQDQQAESFPVGHEVFHEGEPGDRMFAVLSGTVDLLIHGKTVETVDAGGVFGEMALVEDKPRTATAVVKDGAKLVTVDRQRFLFLVQQHPSFALQLMTVMAERLRRMDEKL